MKTTLNLWKMRHLSLIGRILIVKTVAIPKIIYKATILPITNKIIKELDKLITHFIWNSSKPKLKSNKNKK